MAETYPQLFSYKVAIHIIDNVWVFILPHHQNFIDN